VLPLHHPRPRTTLRRAAPELRGLVDGSIPATVSRSMGSLIKKRRKRMRKKKHKKLLKKTRWQRRQQGK